MASVNEKDETNIIRMVKCLLTSKSRASSAKALCSMKNLDRFFKAPVSALFAENYIDKQCDFATVFSSMKPLASGMFGTVIVVCISVACKPKLVMKLIPYYRLDKVDYRKADRPQNVEWRTARMLYNVFANSNFPIHVPVPYDTFLCAPHVHPSFRWLLRKLQSTIDPLAMSLTSQLFTASLFRVMTMEYATFGTVESFLTKLKEPTTYILQIILFQVFVALAIINFHLPSWQHNDLHIRNLLVTKCDYDLVYDLQDIGINKRFVLRKPGIRVLINDFDFASMDTMPNMKKLVDLKAYNERFIFRGQREPQPDLRPNPYVDVRRALVGFISDEFSLPIEALDFISPIIPYARYYLDAPTFLGHFPEFDPTPFSARNLIQNEFFSIFRVF